MHAQFTINTFAGMGTAGSGGDGGPAAAAQFNKLSSLAFDSHGNLYVADMYNNRIRRISATDSTITTIAGTGTMGYTGDGGPATIADIDMPSSIAVDGSGNIYFACANSTIRKVNASGVITTYAGTGTMGYSGDGGPATAAQLGYNSQIRADIYGNIFIADNNRIRKVDASGMISTIAGNGTAGYSGDGGAAIAASLAWPSDLAIDPLGNIYIADAGNFRIRKVSTTGIITTIAGNGTMGFGGDSGPATAAVLGSALQVSTDYYGNVFILDSNRLRIVDATGTINTIAGTGVSGYSGDGGPATTAKISLTDPITWSIPTIGSSIAIDSAKRIYIADHHNNRIRILTLPSLGLTSVSKSREMLVYPNPATSIVYVNTDIPSGDIRLTDMFGRQHACKQIKGKTTSFYTGDLPSGIYFVTWNDDNGAKTTREILIR